MKAVIVAYGHADNVLCLSNHLARYIDIALIFVTGGDHFTRSIFDWNVSELPYGLTTDKNIVNQYIGKRILSYVNNRLKIFIARTPTLKILKDWKRGNFKYVREVASYISDNHYDVVHFNGSSGFQLYFQKLLSRLPKVYTIHDYLPHSGEGRIKLRIVNTILNKIYAKNDYEFIQHYQFLSKKFSEFYNVDRNRVHTVYCGPLEVYKVFEDKEVREEPHTILFFGRISLYKGIKYLIDAFRIIEESLPKARLIIAGEGDLSFDFEHSRAYEVYNYHISNKELVRFIQRASIVVTPYTDATHSAVIMTACAFNKPVVASAVGGIPEVIEDNITGKLVPARNSVALAKTIIDILRHPSKRLKMKQNIEKMSRHGNLSWQHIARRTIEVYKKAIAGHKL